MRLTKALKKEIVLAVRRAVFKDKIEAYYKKQQAVGDALYESLFTPQQREVLESLPKSWFEQRSSLLVENGSREFSVPLASELGHDATWFSRFSIEMSRQRSMPAYLSREAVRSTRDTDAVADRAEELRIADGKLTVELGKMLDSCSTVKRLRESWPDADRHLPDSMTDPAKSLPVSVVAMKQALKAAQDA